MELKVSEIIIDDDEELSSLYFKHKTGYFAIARTIDDDYIYLELDEQIYGENFTPSIFKYNINNGNISFTIDLENKKTINYLKEKKMCYHLYTEIELIYPPVDIEKFNRINEVLEDIFL